MSVFKHSGLPSAVQATYTISHIRIIMHRSHKNIKKLSLSITTVSRNTRVFSVSLLAVTEVDKSETQDAHAVQVISCLVAKNYDYLRCTKWPEEPFGEDEFTRKNVVH